MNGVFFSFESTRRLCDLTEVSTSRPLRKRLLLGAGATVSHTQSPARAFRHASALSHRVTSISLYRVAWFVIVKRNACRTTEMNQGKQVRSVTQQLHLCGPIQRNHSRVINTSNVQFIKPQSTGCAGPNSGSPPSCGFEM